MRNTILTLALILTSVSFCYAQKIESEKVFGGYKYIQNGKNLTLKEMVQLMENNQPAFELIKKAKSNQSTANVLAAIGGGLIGWPIGTAIGGGDANWTLAGIGAGIVAIALPISSGAAKKANQAVDIYNASLTSTTYQKWNPEINFIANANGFGFSLRY